MASPPSSPENGDQSQFHVEDSSANSSSSPLHKMSPRNLALIFVTAWLIVLMPFLFWLNTSLCPHVPDTDKVGTSLHQGGLIAKLQVDPLAVASQNGQHTLEIRSPISGRIHSLFVVPGSRVAAGAEVATVDPGDEQVWEALRALYLIGQPDDLSAIRPYQRELPEISDRVRQQALLTEKSIRERASHP